MALAVDPREYSTQWFEGTRRRRLILLTILIAVVSVGLARVVLSFELGAVFGLTVWVALIVILVRPRYGVYLLLAVLMLFESGSQDPLMLPGNYLQRSLQETLHISGAIFFPTELLVLIVAGAWLARAAMMRRMDFQGGAFGRQMLFFAVALLFGVVRGLLAGATVDFVFWESRFLIAMVLAYVLSSNTIRTRAHVRALLSILFICVTLFSLDGIWRRYALANSGLLGPQEFWFAHEDVVIWGLLIMLVAAQQVFGGPRWQRILGPPAVLVTTLTMLLSERRAGYIAVIVAFLAFGAVLFVVKRKAFVLLVVPTLIAGAIYLPLFWNSTGTLGQAARAVRSINDPDPRDAASNAWRALEAINVRATIASDPLAGVGFGRPFLQVVTVPDISFFEFWNYESHHDVLWVWMKTGAFGFICFFVLLMSATARAAWLVKSETSPELRVFAIVAASGILMSLTFCYVDLGLTTSRLPLILGIMLGTLGVLDRLRESAPTSSLTEKEVSL